MIIATAHPVDLLLWGALGGALIVVAVLALVDGFVSRLRRGVMA